MTAHPEDYKLRRAARRAATLRDGGVAAWAMPGRTVPSAKVYRRKPRTGSWSDA